MLLGAEIVQGCTNATKRFCHQNDGARDETQNLEVK